MLSALVSGASTGIGEACALHLDRLGWRVFAGVRRQADGERLQAQSSARLTPVSLDITDEAEVAAAAKAVAEALDGGGLSGLVNNAGIGLGGPVEYLPLDHWRRQLEVNVLGQLAVTQALMPLIRNATGRIVFIGSISGRVATPMLAPYSASKHALEAICESMRHELRPFGIRTVLVEPGAIKTPI